MKLSISQRVSRLERAARAAAKPEPVEEVVAKLYCDRCGFSCDPRTARITFLARWGEGPEGDLCPKCLARLSQ